VKIVRSKDRVDGSSGKARSMGYGFIEFNTHAHALACLRYLNFRNSRQSFSKKLVDDEEQDDNANKSAHQISRRSLRVMFAIENAQVVKKRDLRFTLKDKRNNSKAEKNSASGGASNGGGAKRKRDGGGEGFQHGKPAKKSRPSQGKSARFGPSKPFAKGKAGGARPGKGKR
ncbi:RNA recognition motif-containing protein, partial [Coemansia sp. RSA 2399]